MGCDDHRGCDEEVTSDLESRTEPGTRRPLGYGLVGPAALLLGVVGTIPFLMLLYTFIQWVLAPLGLAADDTSNNDAVMELLVAGVLLPLSIPGCWAGLVWSLTRRFALARRWTWPLAVAALALPFVLFAITKSS